MGFSITYQRILQLHLWIHHWLDSAEDDGTPIVFLPPTVGDPNGNMTGREIDYDLRTILDIQPSPETQDILAQRGLTFKRTSSGALIAGKDTAILDDTSLRLTFTVKVIDVAFTDYSVLPGLGDMTKPVFHLTNFDIATATRLLLTDGGNDELRAEHFLPRQGRVVRLQLQDNIPAGTIDVEVFDELSTAVTPKLDFNGVSVEADQNYAEIDCRNLPPGRYRFASASLHADQPTVLYLGLENQPQLLGVIDLFPATWVGSQFDVRFGRTT